MVVNTTSIQTDTECFPPKSTEVVPGPGENFTISSTSVKDCNVNVNFNPQVRNQISEVTRHPERRAQVAAQQYGVADASCNLTPNLNITLRPVMFWYFHKNDRDQKPEAKTNNVTQGEFAGKAFNGVLFDTTNNTFIDARGTAAKAGIPGAVFRAASQRQNGLQAEFDSANGFLDLTDKIYTQYLSLAAKSIYFVPRNDTIPARMDSLLPRLIISPIPAHGMALNMVLIGLIGLAVQIVHRRQRKQLHLAAPPGTIASVMALSSHSGFGQLLMPYDSEEKMQNKLSGLRFQLDKRTGALIADDKPPSMMQMKKERDEALQTLLGEHKGVESSSQAAYEGATGYPPWQTQYKTPYDA
ncbi:hypothetical protein AAF712_010584 [Marasmius tenuissimus]|uniref:Uncharacterized protein n=1 Tax=Marasmius tenuissimus TaxID=585030 RepID=A0ABR2ZMJ9_9AGAR